MLRTALTRTTLRSSPRAGFAAAAVGTTPTRSKHTLPDLPYDYGVSRFAVLHLQGAY